MAEVTKISIGRVRDGQLQQLDDNLATEEPLEIVLVFYENGLRQSRPLSITMRTPGHDADLAAGFLFTEGIITSKSDIEKTVEVKDLAGNDSNKVEVHLRAEVTLDWGKLERHFYTSSSCGVCGKSSLDALHSTCRIILTKPVWKVDTTVIGGLNASLRKVQEVFESTGGLHASAIYDLQGHLLFLREDVGRHNALDKVIGAAMQQAMLPLEQHILLLSGRASFELLQKAVMAGIQMVCAIGAPSSLAVETAREFGITLLGFLKENRFNIYACPERVILS